MATAPKTKPPTSPATNARGRAYLRPISLDLPRSLHRQLHEEAARRDTSATAVILGAVNSHHAAIAGQLAKEEHSRTSVTGLFDVPQARQKLAEPVVATTIRVTDAQLEALDHLRVLHGGSRSDIIAAALRIEL